MNLERLNRIIDEIGIPKTKIARELNLSNQTLNYKLKNGNFLIWEALKLKAVLRLTEVEFQEIFLG